MLNERDAAQAVTSAMQIEALETRNYRLFREPKLENLPHLAVVVGANGSGKSTLFDVFTFSKGCAHAECRRDREGRG
jgi:AAA15 family ATPase/GTPase